MNDRKRRISESFGRAAGNYDAAAIVQAKVADLVAAEILRSPPPADGTFLEIGCGTGLLSRRLLPHVCSRGRRLLTDLSPAMLSRCADLVDARTSLAAMDGELPAVAEGSCDLIASSLAAQWFDDLPAAVQLLQTLLNPRGGRLVVATLGEESFHEWRDACQAVGVDPGTPDYPTAATLASATSILPSPSGGGSGWGCAPKRSHCTFKTSIDQHCLVQPFAQPLDFLHALRQLGASVPKLDHQRASPASLRRALARLAQARGVTWHILVITCVAMPVSAARNTSVMTRGFFITGTDTDVGKTIVAAWLCAHWDADYWKPTQAGTAERDVDRVAALSGLAADRVHRGVYELREAMSPHEAARREGVRIDLDVIARAMPTPVPPRPLIVEGAGGALVPLNESELVVDLIARLALPAIVVARSTLGTINHTLLTLAALRSRDVRIAGVILNGPPHDHNAAAIESFGKTRVIAHLPRLASVTREALGAIATPPWPREE